MFSTLLQKTGQAARYLLPVETAFLFVIASALVWPLPYIGTVSPSLGLAAIYYWAVHRPDLFRPSIVFFLGVLNDFIHFLPIGLSAFIFVASYQLVYSQRRFFVGQIFYLLWFGFMIIALLAMIANWIVLSIYNGQPVTFLPVLIQCLFTIVSFPLPAWVLIRLQRAFLAQV